MASVLDRLPEGARVAVIRLRSLGDCVLTTPALALLKESRPDLKIAVVVEDRFRRVFEQSPVVMKTLQPELVSIARFRPQLALNFHGGTRSQWMTAASLAGSRAGFAHHTGSWLYNVPIPRAQQIFGEERIVHTAEHMASAMFYLGVPRQEIPRAQLYCQRNTARPPYAIFHPTASAASKAWPAERFVQIANRLQGLVPVFIGGPGEDLSAFSIFECHAGAPLDQMFSLMQSASLFVGNDSGPAHVAAAFGVPSVVLFGPSNPCIWAPWRTKAEVVHSPNGLAQITVERVSSAIEKLRTAA